jgi:hypothetical protein
MMMERPPFIPTSMEVVRQREAALKREHARLWVGTILCVLGIILCALWLAATDVRPLTPANGTEDEPSSA